jgi:5-formyltetrahydrofolate cyclo-ligase
MDPLVASAASQALVSMLMPLISESVTIVAGYRSIRREVDIAQAMQDCAARGVRLCLPVIEAQDKPLYFRRWRLEDVLEKGRYGVEVPPSDAPFARPDVVLVPLVAFDRTGHRLGYGAGYYDRTIRVLRQQEKNIQMIGVAYSLQEVEQLPVDSNDERLDFIVTEKEVIRCL